MYGNGNPLFFSTVYPHVSQEAFKSNNKNTKQKKITDSNRRYRKLSITGNNAHIFLNTLQLLVISHILFFLVSFHFRGGKYRYVAMESRYVLSR